jgi:hypothetical protein
VPFCLLPPQVMVDYLNLTSHWPGVQRWMFCAGGLQGFVRGRCVGASISMSTQPVRGSVRSRCKRPLATPSMLLRLRLCSQCALCFLVVLLQEIAHAAMRSGWCWHLR